MHPTDMSRCGPMLLLLTKNALPTFPRACSYEERSVPLLLNIYVHLSIDLFVLICTHLGGGVGF